MTNSPFSNEAIKERLFDSRNIEPLEYLIEQEKAKMNVSEAILFNDCAENYGEILPIELVREKLFPEVKAEVDKILNVSRDSPVKIKYYGFLSGLFGRTIGAYAYHNRITGQMSFTKGRKKKLVLALAHEYTHRVQQDMLDWFGGQLLREGMAMRVGYKVPELFAVQKEDNIWRCFIVLQNKFFLERGYIAYCYITGKEIENELAKKHTVFLNQIKNYMWNRGLSRQDIDLFFPHELGTAFFSLSELKHGSSVYARALRRDEGILELH